MPHPELIPFESLIHKLTMQIASHNFGRVHGLYAKLERLRARVEVIKAIFEDDHNKIDKDWIREIKDQVYAADDFFDEIATEILRLDGGKVRSLFSCINAFVFRLQIAREIDEIGKSLEHMNKWEQLARGPARGLAKVEHSYVRNEPVMIGREEEKQAIISLLMEPTDSLLMEPSEEKHSDDSLIGIVGMGGIGKTVLAMMVYKDAQVRDFFDIRMWVCVALNFDVKTIVNEILVSSSGSRSNDQESMETLQIELHKQLNGKKYLLVLDDVWNEDSKKWTELKTYLLSGAEGSKILVTTRSLKVGQAMGTRRLFNLPCLTEENSWSLFKKLVFRDDGNPMIHQLESVGRKIMEKCKGVPLAIITVAHILDGKHTESEWINALEGISWELGERELARSTNDMSIMSSLAFSYQHLRPRQLKQCFAYCSIYPMGWEIEKNELIQLWMAQDYLKCLNGEQEMEDVGIEFVDTLLKMSFFQDPKMDEYGNLVNFKMHGLIHDLALEVASDDYYLGSQRKVMEPIHMCFSLESNAIDLLASIDASRLRTIFLQRTNDRGTGRMTRELSLILTFKS